MDDSFPFRFFSVGLVMLAEIPIGTFRDVAIAAMFKGLCKGMPERIFEVRAQIPDPKGQETARIAIRSVLQSVAVSKPLELATNHKGPPSETTLILEMVGLSAGGREGLKFDELQKKLQSFSSEEREVINNKWILNSSINDPKTTMDEISAGKVPPALYQPQLAALATMAARNEPRTTALWSLSLPESKPRNLALKQSVLVWLLADTATASDWVLGLPAGMESEYGKSAMVEYLIGKGDYELADEWKSQLTNPEVITEIRDRREEVEE